MFLGLAARRVPVTGMVGAHCRYRATTTTIRYSYFHHHATDLNPGGGAYGLTLTEHTSKHPRRETTSVIST